MNRLHRFLLITLCCLGVGSFVAIPQTQATSERDESFAFECNYRLGIGCSGGPAQFDTLYIGDVSAGQTISITALSFTANQRGSFVFNVLAEGSRLASSPTFTDDDTFPQTFNWTNTTGTTQTIVVDVDIGVLCFFCEYGTAELKGSLMINQISSIST